MSREPTPRRDAAAHPAGGVPAPQVDWERLRGSAQGALVHAYAPYSGFPVGAAALVDDGRVVAGCNVENAVYGLGLCAECSLVSALRASGGGRLVAFVCVAADGSALTPCGRCRQLLWEHGGPDLLVDTGRGAVALAVLLPDAFGAAVLEDRRPVGDGEGRGEC